MKFLKMLKQMKVSAFLLFVKKRSRLEALDKERSIAMQVLRIFLFSVGLLTSNGMISSAQQTDCSVLNVSPAIQQVSCFGGTVYFDIQMSSSSCTPIFGKSNYWMTVNYSISGSVATVIASVSPNSSYARTGNISVVLGISKIVLTVAQGEYEAPYIILSPQTLNFPSQPESGQTFTINSNTPAQTISYAGCVTNATRSGNTITVLCGTNASVSMKTGSVTVSGEGVSSSVSVTQASAFPFITVSSNSLSFPYQGGTQTFSISTNTTTQNIGYSGCVTRVTRSGNNISVYCTYNNVTSERTGTVTVTGDGVSSTVTVAQAGFPYISLSPSSLSFEYSGGTQTVTLNTNTSIQHTSVS
ncbi:MAG: BACON domain-containing protein [Mangrovibacterium sp.]